LSIPVVCVGVVCIESGMVLLVKRAGEPNKGYWSIPGGRVEFGETLREAALREIREETGLSVRLGRLIEAVDIIGKDDAGHVKYHYVVIDYEGYIEGGELRAGGDAEEVRWIPLERLRDYQVTNSTISLIEEHFLNDQR